MNQCDGCNAHAPTFTWTSVGVVYHQMGEHDLMICQASRYAESQSPRDPNAPMDPADLASLLEREPHQKDDTIEDYIQKWEDAVRRNLTLRATVDSQAARIQALESLVAHTVAKLLGWTVPSALLAEWAVLIKALREALDPHQPWCRDESHQGACISDPEERDDGE